ncbi:hypothetical protein [Rhodococcus sp. AW25M09]|uniref:hypothetical protein n=1 Tax=Rhodococcus sp. AW25M09 TaxID=1268303 RepID=UPI00034DB31D|nr:hypothetical protein [Rhodococcus sp. AW25M09]
MSGNDVAHQRLAQSVLVHGRRSNGLFPRHRRSKRVTVAHVVVDRDLFVEPALLEGQS